MAYSDTVNLNYESCKNFALSKYAARTPVNQIFLNCFKEKYEGVINSPRTLERISDLETLLKVLEKRGALTPTDIHVLEYIYGELNLNKKMLENHKTLIKGKPNKAIRGEDVENQTPPNNASFHYARVNTPDSAPFKNANYNRQKLSERVVNEISTRVGGSWQELARYLKVQECKIHGISQDPSLKSNEAKTRVMLQEYEKHIVPEELKIKLMKALRLAGRMDIHDDVEKLFLRETSTSQDNLKNILVSQKKAKRIMLKLEAQVYGSGEGSSIGNSPGSANLPEPPDPTDIPETPEHAGGEGVFPIPLLPLLHETLNRVCSGNIVHTDGEKPTEKHSRTKKRHKKYLSVIYFNKVFLLFTIILATLVVSALILYKMYEIISSLDEILWLTYGFTFLWILLYASSKVAFLIVKEIISILKSMLWVTKNIRKKGVQSTVHRCVKVVLKETKSWFRNDKIEEKELCPDINIISTGLTTFNCTVWFVKNVYKRGMASTIQYCLLKILHKIKIGIKSCTELKNSLPDQNNQTQRLESRYISNLASKLSKFLINLYQIFGCVFFYLTIFLLFTLTIQNFLKKYGFR